MKVKKHLNLIIITFITIGFGIIVDYFMAIVIASAIIVFLVFRQKLSEKSITKKAKEREHNEFHRYLKSVILLTYTRPLKNAFKDVKINDCKPLEMKISKFITEIRYDFSIEPYKKLALSINNKTDTINYELNIMYLLFELEKKGLGTIFINDVLNEINELMNNIVEEKIIQIQENSYLYILPPTVINFFYLSIILFRVIDEMMMSVLP